jgi:hypothetical protein
VISNNGKMWAEIWSACSGSSQLLGLLRQNQAVVVCRGESTTSSMTMSACGFYCLVILCLQELAAGAAPPPCPTPYLTCVQADEVTRLQEGDPVLDPKVLGAVLKQYEGTQVQYKILTLSQHPAYRRVLRTCTCGS